MLHCVNVESQNAVVSTDRAQASDYIDGRDGHGNRIQG